MTNLAFQGNKCIIQRNMPILPVQAVLKQRCLMYVLAIQL